MTPIKRVLTVAVAGATTLGLSALGFAALPASAMAASRVVTVPEPAMSSLDPAEWGGQILIDQGTILEGLFGYNQNNQVVPKIASSWHLSNGGQVWTIDLRHNAKWSNGKPVTAQDFYYAWMRLASPTDTAGALWAGVMSNVVNAWAYHGGGVPASAVGLKVINNYEIQLDLTGPMNIEGELAIAGSMPLYPPDVQNNPTTWFEPANFVGDGPYVVKSFVVNGDVDLVKNPYYVGSGTAADGQVGNVQQIDLIPAPSVPVEDYESNAIDVGEIGSTSDYAYAKAHMASQLHKTPVAQINYLEWDKSVDPSPLDNQMVREAVAMALDRGPISNKALVGMVGSTSVAAYPGWPGYNLEKNPYSYNVAAARKLLARAGYPNGRGIGTLYLYTQTAANSPEFVTMAEAVAAELKTNLNLNFKIEPTNSTLWGELTWGGIEPGILPGYNLAVGVANWSAPLNNTLQINQWISNEDSGAIGSVSYRQHAEQWNFYPYDPQEVKAWGNPADASEGTSYSQWQPLIKAAQSAISYLTAYNAKQPKLYQEYLNPPGAIPASQELTNYEKSFSTATTAAAKHDAWVTFWKWVGSFPNGGDSGASIGLVDQVYIDQHQTELQRNVEEWYDEMSIVTNTQQIEQLQADIVNALVGSAYFVPLNYQYGIYLEKPWVTGVQVNPWAWGNFYQLQYMNEK